jgi:hypothetical protein
VTFHTQGEELAAEHLIREHHRGRALAEILDDDYITRRCTETQIARLLDRPDVVRAVGVDVLEARKAMYDLHLGRSLSRSTPTFATR